MHVLIFQHASPWQEKQAPSSISRHDTATIRSHHRHWFSCLQIWRWCNYHNRTTHFKIIIWCIICTTIIICRNIGAIEGVFARCIPNSLKNFTRWQMICEANVVRVRFWNNIYSCPIQSKTIICLARNINSFRSFLYTQYTLHVSIDLWYTSCLNTSIFPL